MKNKIHLAGLTVALCLAVGAPAVRANTYQLDDGTAEDAVGAGNADLIALNQFTVIGNQNMIMSISIAWGSPNVPDPTLNGLTYTAVIWSDPNNDGNPNDAQVIATAPGVITGAGTNTFDVTLFPTCPTVTRSFFVGFIITGNDNQYPAGFDETAPLSNRSFAAVGAAGMGDIYNLNNNLLPVDAVENYGLDGNFMIRADACAVPEPPSLALAAIGGMVGVFIYRRKRQGLLQPGLV